MKDNIRNVIEADLEGQERLEIETEKTKKAIEDIQRDKLNVQSKVWEEAKVFLESEKKRLADSLARSEAQAQKYFNDTSKKLENKFNKNREKWIKDIVDACTLEAK